MIRDSAPALDTAHLEDPHGITCGVGCGREPIACDEREALMKMNDTQISLPDVLIVQPDGNHF